MYGGSADWTEPQGLIYLKKPFHGNSVFPQIGQPPANTASLWLNNPDRRDPHINRPDARSFVRLRRQIKKTAASASAATGQALLVGYA